MLKFLQYVSEGRVVRRQSDLRRYTFSEIQEKLYLSFLALSYLKNFKNNQSWLKSYADNTLTFGNFDLVRMAGNDLYNMLSVVDGQKDIVKKLKNSKQAEALRQRHILPTFAVRRYLHKFRDDYVFLVQLENSLNIKDPVYKIMRRQLADFNNLNSIEKKKLKDRLSMLVKSKLTGTEIAKKVLEQD